MTAVTAPISAEQVMMNYQQVVERVHSAARRCGRDPGEIIIMGATKSVDVARIRAAIGAGLQHIGENYVQEALRKYEVIGDAVTWHFIGHLQRNKAKYVVRFCSMVHSVDRLSLAQELSKRALALGRIMDVLIEVNLGGEESKSGVPPDEAIDLIRTVATLEGIRICGLMCIPPYLPDPEDVRPYFRQLRELAERVNRVGIPKVKMEYLSMGMSHDFEVAIEEGANIVRIGTAIFGPRR